jgi:hypothetical protein
MPVPRTSRYTFAMHQHTLLIVALAGATSLFFTKLLRAQVWIDPTKDLIYLLLIQRSNLPNSDASDIRKAFQDAAAAALK